jgi:tryptophan synthase alpha chain
VKRIVELFERKREAGEKSLLLFLSAGFPSLEFTAELLPRLPEWGCDLIELGIPFSDPIADGPTIQAASADALKAGTSVREILALLPAVRAKIETPIILFTALNPLLKYGLEEIVRDAKAAGADGFLVADLPPEEGKEFADLCAASEMALVFLVAPTTSPERLQMIAERSTGFIYYIARRGVTGARQALADDLEEQVKRVSAVTDKPIAVGFGVSQPEHVRQVAQFADGIVVGSALIDIIRASCLTSDPMPQIEAYVRSLAEAK